MKRLCVCLCCVLLALTACGRPASVDTTEAFSAVSEQTTVQTQTQGATIDPARDGVEHDIMESFDPGKVIPACFHYNGTGPEYRNFCIPDEHPTISTFDVDTDTFHRYGLLWTPDGYSVYVDGRLRGTSSKAVSQTPEFILVSTEAIGFRPNHPTRKGDERLEAAFAAKDEFVIDYVRVFDVVEEGKQ